MKKILATLVTAVVIGAGGLAVASAANSPASTTASSPDAAAAATTTSATRGVAGRARKFAFATAAQTIGISPAELLKEMKGGHSIADVATAHHVDPATVVKAVSDALDARIQQAETNGRISSDQAAKLEQAVTTRVPKLVNAKPRQIHRARVVHAAVDLSAKTIGITPTALRQAIASGQSVAQVATAHHVAPSTVVSALVKAGDARVDQAVAKHHLDPARAAKLKARLPQLAQKFVDFTRGAAKQPAAAAA